VIGLQTRVIDESTAPRAGVAGGFSRSAVAIAAGNLLPGGLGCRGLPPIPDGEVLVGRTAAS
jgi:hypothetical protein